MALLGLGADAVQTAPDADFGAADRNVAVLRRKLRRGDVDQALGCETDACSAFELPVTAYGSYSGSWTGSSNSAQA